jgi:OmcA/MtrC family decaheme c-type cytochrome
MVDDPAAWAALLPAGTTDPKYDYKANLMNDTHMAHAMEFPYPMTMANCVTCHEGKLTQILADEKFTGTTCKSCHPVEGKNAWASADEPYAQPNRAPPFLELWTNEGLTAVHAGGIGIDCQACHSEAAGIARTFSELHTGYDATIYDATGTKYRDMAANLISVTSVTKTGDVLDIKVGSPNVDIVPQVTVSFYGWDSKDFLVSCHTRDANGNRMEKTIGTDNPLFTEEADSVPGAWHVTLDLAAYTPAEGTGLDNMSIPDLITAGKVKQAEVAVLPKLVVDGIPVALNAPSMTVDVSADGVDQFVPNYFKGTAALVDETKCNACHDALATTFHTTRASDVNVEGAGNRSGNIVVCRTCHVVTSGGSHLEMQSRSIDSYVHAIHSFQAFDSGDIDFTDPVEAARYDLHVEHVFPNFTIRNCEACHVGPDVGGKVVYNVPDQSKSMPARLSGSDTWNVDRNIGTVPTYVTGPASKACGGCHRANFITEDEAGELASWNQHTANGGYLVDDSEATGANDSGFVYDAIDKIMSMFE